MRQRPLLHLGVLACLLIGGCDAGAEGEGSAGSAGERLMERAGEAGESAAEFATEQARKHCEECDERLAELDSELERLQAGAAELAGEARERWEEDMVRIRGRRLQVLHKRDALQQAGEEAYEDAKSSLDRAWNDLRESLEKAAQDVR